jgi:CDP-glycerol glycerophosphotransferase
VCTFEGKGGFGCNPKYIVEELHRRNSNYKFVWFVNKDIINEKQFPKYIRKVPNTTWSRAYWLSTSKVWIDNYRKPYGTKKRRGQYYLNTWHGDMGFKPIGLWRGESFSTMAYLVSKNDSDMIDDVIIESDYCKYIFGKGLLYEGNYLKFGQPRCDILAQNRSFLRDKFRDDKNIPRDAKIVIFAPTYRETSVNGKRSVLSEIWSIDIEKVKKAFEQRFGGEWRVCIRLHPQLAYIMQSDKTNSEYKQVIDATFDDDMYEVLSAVDAYITDYSSAAFDASYTRMPVFLLMDDLEKYTNDRGTLMWNIGNGDNNEVHNNRKMIPEYDLVLPYTISQNSDELVSNILKFDEEKYLEKLDKMNETVNLVFDGKASQRTADHIMKILGDI